MALFSVAEGINRACTLGKKVLSEQRKVRHVKVEICLRRVYQSGDKFNFERNSNIRNDNAWLTEGLKFYNLV